MILNECSGRIDAQYKNEIETAIKDAAGKN